MNKNSLFKSTCLSLFVLALLPTAASAQAYPATQASSAQPLPQYSAASSPFAPISDRIVSDPLFLPRLGQFYGTTAYTFANPTGDRYSDTGASRNSFSGNNNLLDQTLAYGISDEFSLHFGMAYGINSTDTTSSRTGIDTNGNSNGFTNPTFGATYRVVDQARHMPVDVDLSVNYSPDMLDEKNAGGGHEGTIASGRQIASFTALVGHEMKIFTVDGFLTASYFGDETFEDLGTDDRYRQDSYIQYQAGVNSQTRINNRMSFNVGVDYSLPDHNPKTTNDTTGAYYSTGAANVLAVSTAFNYHFMPNRLVGSLTYTYQDYMDSATDYPLNTSNVDTRNHMSNIFGARLQYLFN